MVILALAIGANIILFKVADTALFASPRHVARPERLVRTPLAWSTLTDHLQLRRSLRLMSIAGHSRPISMSLWEDSQSEAVDGQYITHDYFAVLGVDLILGTGLEPVHDIASEECAAILAHRLWRRQFDEDPLILGSGVRISGRTCTVVGVAPEGFLGLDRTPIDLWLSSGIAPRRSDGREQYWIALLGRLLDGITIEQAQSELTSLYPLDAALIQGPAGQRQVTLVHVREGLTRLVAQLDPVVVGIFGAGLTLLLLGCLNITCLFMSHAIQRRRDVEIRLQLGAGRMRLLREWFVEVGIMSVVCSTAALLLTYWLAGVVEQFLARPSIAGWGFMASTFSLNNVESTVANGGSNVRVIWAALTLAAVSSFIVGLGPALAICGSDVRRPSTTQHGSEKGQSQALRGLVCGQVVLTMMLLGIGGLLARSLVNVLQIDYGVKTDNVLVARVELTNAGYDRPTADLLMRRLLDEIKATPGVTGASLSLFAPFTTNLYTSFHVTGRTLPYGIGQNAGAIGPFVDAVSSDYFSVLGLRVLRGRTFLDLDKEGGAPVVVVNERMVADVWPDGSPLGECVVVGRRSQECRQIVGVVSSVRSGARRTEFHGKSHDPGIYLPATQYSNDSLAAQVIVVGTEGEFQSVMRRIGLRIQTVAPELPYVRLEPLSAYLDDQSHSWRVAVGIFGVFGGLALFVAAVGIFAVLAVSVRSRRTEIGVRMAVGATPGAVSGMMLREVLTPVVLGIVVGGTLTLPLAYLVEALLFGIRPIDPISLLGSGCVVAAVASLACVIPARWAAQVDPSDLLRCD